MLSIPEIATQIVNKSLSEASDESSRTLFIVGSKGVGKSTAIYSFLDKSDPPRETLVLDYSFGRKSNQKQGLEKTICHVWEYGGKLDLLKKVLTSVPVRGQFYYCVMVDLSKIKSIWTTLETGLQAMNDTFAEATPEPIIICGKYDLFKNYDSEIKKFICTTIRCVALLCNAHIISYSSKEQALARRSKDLFYGIGFGNGVSMKERNSNFSKPLAILKGTDTWENIGVPKCTLEQIKTKHLSRIASDPEIPANIDSTSAQRSHPEQILDSLASLKYEELRNVNTLDISIDDYLLGIH